ncbi:hypothetical protein B0J14DRAFT_487960, partial [Halenospora varia]
YSEATRYFYSHNSFNTNIADQIEFMPRQILRSRIDCIRVLDFRWRIPREPPFLSPKRWRAVMIGEIPHYKNERWVTTWQVLASMKNLQKLCVKLDVGRSGWEDMAVDRAVPLLKPIMEVTRPKEFRLELPFVFKSEDLEVPWRDLPYRMRCMKRYGP